jgi:hypothetical protein
MTIYEAVKDGKTMNSLRHACRQVRSETEDLSYNFFFFQYDWKAQSYSNLHHGRAWMDWGNRTYTGATSYRHLSNTRDGVLPLDLEKAKRIKYLLIRSSTFYGSRHNERDENAIHLAINQIRSIFPNVHTVVLLTDSSYYSTKLGTVYILEDVGESLQLENYFQERPKVNSASNSPEWKVYHQDGFSIYGWFSGHYFRNDTSKYLKQRVLPIPLAPVSGVISQLSMYRYYGRHDPDSVDMQNARDHILKTIRNIGYEAVWDEIASHYLAILQQMADPGILEAKDRFTPHEEFLPSPAALMEMVEKGYISINRRPKTPVYGVKDGRWFIRDSSSRYHDDGSNFFHYFLRLVSKNTDIMGSSRFTDL